MTTTHSNGNEGRWAGLGHASLAFFTSRLALALTGYADYRLYAYKSGPLAQIFCQWDCWWYLDIAEHGYDPMPTRHPAQDAANWAFFPLFPLLVRLLATVLSATRNVGVFAVIPLAILALDRYGPRQLVRFQGDAPRALLALALAPLGLFLYMGFLHRHVGDALAFKNVQLAWGRTGISNPLTQLLSGLWTWPAFMPMS